MNLILGFLALVSLVYVHGQGSGDKSSSMIPFPRIGRAQGSNLPGLIPFPRIGRSGIQEGKRQLIPFPRVGKRPSPYWHYSVDPYFFENEEYPTQEGSNSLSSNSDSSNTDGDDSQMWKRNNNGAGSNGMWFGPRLGK